MKIIKAWRENKKQQLEHYKRVEELLKKILKELKNE